MNAVANIIDTKHILRASENITQTPAFIYDESDILNRLSSLSEVRNNTACKVLYSIKAAPQSGLLKTISNHVDGFSASSLFECQLAKESLANGGSVHITTPGLRKEDIGGIVNHADYISFNSLSQWQNYKKQFTNNVNCGLRVNPEISFAKDERYDPCRKYSKLGIAVSELINLDLDGIQGLHLHNNCESHDYSELQQTVDCLCHELGPQLERMQWLNLGGGYFIDDRSQLQMLECIINDLKNKYALDVFIEPGKGIVRSAGYLVASVIDLIESDGKQIAILDTSINHLPEVFEYQFRPDIVEDQSDGIYEYRLAGCSCLSGDLFGDYHFEQALQIGSRVIFRNVGAYMFVKANMFNGINLPTVYLLQSDKNLVLQKEYSYKHFKERYQSI